MRIPLIGNMIVSLECGVSLALRTQLDHEIRIETGFRVEESGFDSFHGVPGEALSDNNSVRGMVGRVVTDAQASESGELRIEFADDARLIVPADADFEAWTIASPDGFKAVCVAGGGLAVWD